MKNLLIYCPAMTRMRGGIEKIAADIASRSDAFPNIDIHIVSHNRGDETATQPVYSLPDSVTVTGFNFGLTAERIDALRDFIMRSGASHLLVMDGAAVLAQFMLAVGDLDIPIMYSEHFAPEASAAQLKNPDLRSNLVRLTDATHFLLHSYSRSTPTNYDGGIFVIENAVNAAKKIARPEIPNSQDRYTVINVARLHFWQKRQDILVQAFARAANKFPNWDLRLVGDVHNSHDYSALMEAIQNSGLSGRIAVERSMPHESVLEALSQSHIFALPSDFEGSPISLAEALVHGLPAIGFENCPGVNEVILHGRNGFLAPGLADFESFAECLELLMSSERLRREFGDSATTIKTEREPQQILDTWWQSISWLTERKTSARFRNKNALEHEMNLLRDKFI